jgi:SAM-dependent methyltransferase
VSAELGGARWRRLVREDWTRAGTEWEHREPMILYSIAAVNPALVRALDLAPGHRVLDFGSGLGEPALEISQWIAPRGSVLGIDVSPTMIAAARRRARSRGVANVRFQRGDIARFDPGAARFDRVVSRFGLMFVDDVPLTLGHLRRFLKPRGRLALAVWAEAARNPYFTLAGRVLRPYLQSPPVDPEHAPHPLRFGRRALIPRLLREAGFRKVRTREVLTPFVFTSPESCAQAIVDSASVARQLPRSLTRRQHQRIFGALAREAGRYLDGALVRIPAVARVVSAER